MHEERGLEKGCRKILEKNPDQSNATLGKQGECPFL